MHISSSIHPLFTWSIIKILLLSCNLCRSQGDAQCSTKNCHGQEEIVPISSIDYSSPSMAVFSPFDSESTQLVSSSSSSSFNTHPLAPASAASSSLSPEASSSSSSSSSSPSTFSSPNFISISPRSSSIASVAASRRRKSKYPSKSIKKSRYMDPGQTIECHRRKYTYMATNTDSNGRRCWQSVTTMACWGRCDSYEYPDWEFPFKTSFHPVCTHNKTRTRQIKLRYCDEGVDESLSLYQFTEAISCSCKLCQSSTASCRIFIKNPSQYKK